MHINNRKWLEHLRIAYSKNFKNCSVLEIGSQDVNGTIRDYFTDCDYVGIDHVDGKGVDIVMKSTETKFSKKFDTIAMFSVFEHDLTWKQTIKHNLQWLKDDGMLFISFGAEGNLRHMKVWKPVPHQEFLDYCTSLGLKVIESFFEEERYGSGDKGIYNAILQKS